MKDRYLDSAGCALSLFF